MARRWAFIGVTLLTALTTMRCSSNVAPPLTLGTGAEDGGSLPSKQIVDSAPTPDTAPATASAMTLTPNTVSFGAVNCGTTAQPQTVQVINSSGATVSLGLYFEQNSGYFTAYYKDPVSGQNVGTSVASLAANAAITLVITPVAVPTAPQTANTTANAYKDVIEVVVNGGSNTANAIPITESAQGAIFAFDTTSIDFQQVPVDSTSVAQTIQVANNGSEGANFQLTAAVTGDGGTTPLFAVTQPTGPLAAGQSVQLGATFSPTSAGSATGEVTLSLADNTPLCGPLPKGVTLSGTGVVATTIVSVDGDAGVAGGITFGPTNCGSTAPPATVTITNTGTAESTTWSAKFLSGGTNYSLSATSGTVPANSSTTFNIIPNTITIPSPVTADYYAATLQVTSGTDNQTTTIPIHQTAQGAIITTTGNGTTNFQQLNFGGVSVNQTATTIFTVTNSGNLPINGLQLSNANTAFAVNPGGSNPQVHTFNVAALGSTTGQVTFTPSQVTPYSDTATYSAPSNPVLCQALPPNFTLSGSGNTGIAIAPTSLNFGLAQCGAGAAPSQQITITNQGGATTWSGTFGRGTQPYYQMTTPDGGVLAPSTVYPLPAGDTTVEVVPNPITAPASTSPNAFSDTLTITTGAASDSPHVISLSETAQGAYLSFTSNGSTITSIFTNPTELGGTATTSFQITNSGNLPAYFYTTTSLAQGNDTSIMYSPAYPGPCQTYTVTNPYANQCAPPGMCTEGTPPQTTNYSITLPEFCTNLTYSSSSPGSLAPGASQNGVLDGTGYPYVSYQEALGYLTLTTCTASNVCTNVPNTIICSDPVLVLPLSEPSY